MAQANEKTTNGNGKENRGKSKRKQDTISKIVRTTKRMIKDKGYAHVSTNHIAKNAGCSIGLIYKYFPHGKPDILLKMQKRTLFFRTFNRVDNELLDKMNEMKRSDLKKLAKRFFMVFIMHHRHEKAINSALEIAHLSDAELFETDPEFFYKDSMKVIGRMLEYFIVNHPNSTVLKEDNISTMTKLIFISFTSITRQHILYGKIVNSDDELANYLVNLLYKFLS